MSKYWNDRETDWRVLATKSLHDLYVPRKGPAFEPCGEAIRIMVNVCYEWHNNGGINYDDEPGNRHHDGIEWLKSRGVISVEDCLELHRILGEGYEKNWRREAKTFDRICDRVVDWAVERSDEVWRKSDWKDAAKENKAKKKAAREAKKAAREEVAS